MAGVYDNWPESITFILNNRSILSISSATAHWGHRFRSEPSKRLIDINDEFPNLTVLFLASLLLGQDREFQHSSNKLCIVQSHLILQIIPVHRILIIHKIMHFHEPFVRKVTRPFLFLPCTTSDTLTFSWFPCMLMKSQASVENFIRTGNKTFCTIW